MVTPRRAFLFAVAGSLSLVVACAAILDLPPLEVIEGDSSAVDAGPDAPSGEACAPKCDPNACGDDGCGGTCSSCTAGAECVSGKCFPCTDAWRADNVFGFALAYDAKKNFVFATVPVDGGAAVATLNACTGAMAESRALAPSTAGIDPVPDFHELVRSGDFLYSRGSCSYDASPPDMCVYRYNVATNVVDARGSIAVTNPLDQIWNVTATASGRVFASGTFGGVNQPRIAALEPNGTNCGGAAVDAGSAAYAIGASGDDVYQVINTGAPGQLVLAHFVGSTCATSGGSCACAPQSISPALTLPDARSAGSAPRTFSLLVRGNIVYVVGAYTVSAGGEAGFVVAFDVAQKRWSPPSIYSASGGTKTDGLLYATITPDEKLLYVVGAKDAFGPGATGVLLRFDLPFSFDVAPKSNGEIEVAGASIVWQVAVSASSVFLAAVGPGGSSFVEKCTTSLACPK
jgi:hypothetical protein